MPRVSAPVPRFTSIEERDPIARVFEPLCAGIQVLRIRGATVQTVGKVPSLDRQDQVVGRCVSREADRLPADGHGDRQEHPLLQRFEESEVHCPGAATHTRGPCTLRCIPLRFGAQNEISAGVPSI